MSTCGAKLSSAWMSAATSRSATSWAATAGTQMTPTVAVDDGPVEGLDDVAGDLGAHDVGVVVVERRPGARRG